MKLPWFLLCVLGFSSVVASNEIAQSDISETRQQQLRHLLKHDCGACHGLTMKGGLGSALTADALKGKPNESLVATILFGRLGTPMPAWRDHLTEAEAFWLVQQLRRYQVSESETSTGVHSP